jgi:gamma-glutamylcyclotransferase (GGCT)/AIG2-like uncharacterized protein YtfP
LSCITLTVPYGKTQPWVWAIFYTGWVAAVHPEAVVHGRINGKCNRRGGMVPVFVYGTLKPGEAYFETFCKPYINRWVPAQTIGTLFHLPMGYPALAADSVTPEGMGDRWVYGAVLHFKTETEIAQLDDFEGYNPALPDRDNQYVRQWRSIFSREQQSLGEAWMYVMTQEQVLKHEGILIPDGTWTRQQWPSITPKSIGGVQESSERRGQNSLR